MAQIRALLLTGSPEDTAIVEKVLRDVEVVARHKARLHNLGQITDEIVARLYALLCEGSAADVITFRTKKGGPAYHRIPFLGDRESVSDALLKIANAMSRILPLERQAHGLESSEDRKQPVILNVGGITVQSEDGRARLIKRTPATQGEVVDGVVEQISRATN